MFGKHIQPWIDWLRHVVTQPREELDRWQYLVRFSYELGVHGWRALNRDNAPQMAAALAFRTLFAMLPVVVVTAVLVKAMQGMDQFKRMVAWLIEAMGIDAVHVQIPSTAVDIGDPNSVPLGTWLQEQVDKMANLNLAALGWVGLGLMIYSAISLMITIENSFNAIYGAPEGRSWMRRIPMYWFVLTLGPLFIGLTLVLDNQFESFIAQVGILQWLLAVLKVVYGFSAAWLFMFAVYRLVPNTRVTTQSALAGAFVAAFFWQAGRSLLGMYFNNAVSFGNIYGTLGAVPIFMFFVYLMWLVVLFGLEVSATVQRVQGLQLDDLHELKEKQPQSGLIDPAAIVGVMEIVVERFAAGRSASAQEISEEAVVPEAMVSKMLDRLVREGFLHRVDAGEDGTVTMARPPDQIPADRLIEIGYELVDEGGAGRQSALVQKLRDAQRALARQATLASVLAGRAEGRPGQVAS